MTLDWTCETYYIGVPGEILIFVTVAASKHIRSPNQRSYGYGCLSRWRAKASIRRVQTIVRNWLSSYRNKNQNFSRNPNLRKVIKNRSLFPNDEAVYKLLYLALKNIEKKWTMPIRDWKQALQQFAIVFEGRMPLP
jgi:hypothetical protein